MDNDKKGEYMSYSKLYFHFIFRTKYNLPAIDIMYERELYAYMMGIIQNTSSKLLRIGGMPDHLHLAVEMNHSCLCHISCNN